jgi:hypothetical protein
MSLFNIGEVIAELDLIIDEIDSLTTYIGYAQIGSLESEPVWQIRKAVRTGTVTKFLWADGDSEFDNVWSDHLSLTYSL